MTSTHDPRANQLLAVLPEGEWLRLAPHPILTELPLGHVVYEAGDQLGYVYFPITSIVSLL